MILEQIDDTSKHHDLQHPTTTIPHRPAPVAPRQE